MSICVSRGMFVVASQQLLNFASSESSLLRRRISKNFGNRWCQQSHAHNTWNDVEQVAGSFPVIERSPRCGVDPPCVTTGAERQNSLFGVCLWHRWTKYHSIEFTLKKESLYREMLIYIFYRVTETSDRK